MMGSYRTAIMTRHTISPIWCVALLLSACSGEPTQPLSSPEVSLEEARTLPETAVFAAPPAVPPTGIPESEGLSELGSAMAPEPPAIDASSDGELRVVTGFTRPSAALYDPEADVYLVTNVTEGLDGVRVGYISKVDPEGELIAERWIDGAPKGVTLNDPRGMAMIRSRLYVADGEHVRVFDRRSGVRRGVIRVPGASRLSGLAVGKRGALIATDAAYDEAGRATRSDAVYRINRAGRVSALFRSSVLGHPVAVQQMGSMLWIATAGSGKLYGLSQTGRLAAGPSLDEGRLAGMIQIGPREVAVVSRAAEGVYVGDLEGGLSYLSGGISAPGHPAWDSKRRRLLIPSEDRGELRVVPLAERS